MTHRLFLRILIVAALTGITPLAAQARQCTSSATDSTTADSLSRCFRRTKFVLRLEPAIIRATPAFSAASSRVIRQFDLALRPRESSQELLRLVPGLVIAQHAGGGK